VVEHTGDVVGGGGDLDDSHAPLAAGHGTDADIDGEGAPEFARVRRPEA